MLNSNSDKSTAQGEKNLTQAFDDLKFSELTELQPNDFPERPCLVLSGQGKRAHVKIPDPPFFRSFSSRFPLLIQPIPNANYNRRIPEHAPKSKF